MNPHASKRQMKSVAVRMVEQQKGVGADEVNL
jgi:hypothetical protein